MSWKYSEDLTMDLVRKVEKIPFLRNFPYNFNNDNIETPVAEPSSMSIATGVSDAIVKKPAQKMSPCDCNWQFRNDVTLGSGEEVWSSMGRETNKLLTTAYSRVHFFLYTNPLLDIHLVLKMNERKNVNE